jgi:hypothetical protein
MLDVSRGLLLYVSRLLRRERARRGTRLLTCYRRAVFVLAWFRDKPEAERLGAGFGLSRATAYRYCDEGVAILAAQAPDLHEALRSLQCQLREGCVFDVTTDENSDVRIGKSKFHGIRQDNAGLTDGCGSLEGDPTSGLAKCDSEFSSVCLLRVMPVQPSQSFIVEAGCKF